MKYCPSCQREYSDDYNFCEDDGTKLIEKKTEQSSVKSSDKIVCPSCGKENMKTAHFCEFCGANLQKRSQEKIKQQSKFKQKYQQKKKLYNVLFALLVVIVIALVAGYQYGKSYYSKDQQIERFATSLNAADPKKLAEVVVSGDKNFNPSAKNLTSFTDYLKQNKDYAALLNKNLYEENATNHDVYVKKAGKYFFLFDKYELVLQPVYFNIHTNVKGMELAMNDQKEAVSDNEDYTWKLGPVAPGHYQFDANFDLNGKTRTVDRTVNQVNREKLKNNRRDLSFAVKKVKFDFESPLKNGELLLDGKPLADIKSGKAEGVSFVWNADEKLQIKQELGDLTVTSAALDFAADDYLEKDYEKGSLKYSPAVFQIYPSTNAKSGDFYINDKKVRSVSEDGYEDPIIIVPTEKPYHIQLKQKLADTELKSKTETIDPLEYPELSASADLEIAEGIDDYEISDRLTDLYYDVADFTDEELDFGNSEAAGLADYFSGGSDNADYIDFKDNFIIPARKAKKKAFVNSELEEVEKVTRTSTNNYDVQYVVHYETVYNDDTDSVSQYFRYKKAAFVVEDGVVRIKDLRGKDNFEEVPAGNYE